MQEKQKRKKWILVAVVVTFVIMTSAFIWTLARYVISTTASDEANVATFGLNISNKIDLFSESYTNAATNTEGKKIIAPGTSGSSKFTINGTSEVAYKVSAEVSITYSDEWENYKPLEFSLDGVNWKAMEAFQTELSGALAQEDMAPNTAYTSTQEIYWNWPYFVSTENDAKDTAMGAKAAGENPPKVMAEIKVTATQID